MSLCIEYMKSFSENYSVCIFQSVTKKFLYLITVYIVPLGFEACKLTDQFHGASEDS